MSADYPVGTVAEATVRGVEDTLVMRTTDLDWVSAPITKGDYWHTGQHVTDVRPLVVLDLGDYDNRAVTYLRNIARDDLAFDGDITPRAKLVNLIADQIEAQTKPPRIPEPGKYGVVQAGHPHLCGARSNFIRIVDEGDGRRWFDETYEADLSKWDDLIDPVLVHEGVSDDN